MASYPIMKPSSFSIEIEQNLIAASKNGDKTAYERIYFTFEKPVYNLAYRIAQNRHDAQDILQETFIKTFQCIHQYRGASPFWAWLRQITLHTTLQHLRNQRRQYEKTIHFYEQQTLNNEYPDSSEISDHTSLYLAYSQLAIESRTILWLYHVEGLTHKEIAKLMKKTISFSKSQLSRAHTKLRKQLLSNDEVKAPCKKTIVMI